jgi:lysine biosynthesis protein LysW
MEAICPECDASIHFEHQPKIGQRVRCSQCNSILSVIRLMPLELDWAFIEPFEDHLSDDGRERTPWRG